MNPLAYIHISSNSTKKAAAFLSMLMLLLVVSLPVFPQAAVGTILGGVFDSSGGAIAGAQVTILDVARGTSRVLTTDASGQYTAPSLLSGTYTVRATAKGFQTVEHSNVLLEVASEVRVDLALSPGEQTQTVTVTSEAPAIDTTNATLGGTVTNTSIVQLPLVTRNFLQLLTLRPGSVESPGSNGSFTSNSTNGRREGTDVVLVEGVTQFDLATSNVLINGSQKGSSVDELPLDSVQEFSVQQNPLAEYGWRDGSAINLGVKSGTNNIHGSAYAFGRDARATDAKTYSGAVGPEQLGNLTVEQPGFTLGGPILKNKLFWFVSAEFIRQSQFNANSLTVPTDIAGLGSSFSMVDACVAQSKKAGGVNPLSAQIAGIVNYNNPAGANFCIPQPSTSTFENLFPFNPTNVSTIFPANTTTTPSNNGLAKVDWDLNQHHHLDGFVYISRQTTIANGSVQPFWGTLGIGKTSEYAGAWTWTPNSSWVNDLRGGAAPNTGNSVAQDLARLSGSPYPQGYSVNTGVTNPAYGGFLCVQITGLFASPGARASGLGQCGKNGERGPQYQMNFSDKVSHLFGNHALKFGYEEVFVHFEDSSLATLNGQVNFSSLQNFLAGSTNGGNIITGDNTDNYRERWHAAFVQDTWRITHKITLSPGIRWEYIGSPHSTVNKLGTFDPSQPGGTVQVGPGLPDHTVTHPQKTNFNPRVGVAWDIFGNGKTVLRGGVGQLSSFPAILTVTGAQVPYGDTLCTVVITNGTACPAASIAVNRYGTVQNSTVPNQFSFPKGALDSSWTTTGPAIFPTSLVTATTGPTCSPGGGKTGQTTQCSMLVSDPNFKNPKSIQWNVDIQRAITNNLTLDVAYVGVHGYDETHSVDLNEAPLGTGWNTPWTAAQITAFNANLPRGQSALKAGDAGFTSSQICVGQAVAGGGDPAGTCVDNTAAITAARPYSAQFPYYQYIVETTSGFRSNYSGLQVTLDGRNYHGLSFLAAYTYGHALDDWTKSSQATSALADPAHPQYQYGNSDMDVRHRLRFSPTYSIPGRKGFGQMLEGWQISGIWALQSGFAWAPNDQSTNDWGGTGENFDSAIPSPNNGVWQTWNYAGPHSAFNITGSHPIPCYGQLSGCTLFASAPANIQTACNNAATAPYGGAGTALGQLALQAMANNACYIQNGGILTPPAYGTLGNGSRGMFRGPRYENVDVALEKMWHWKERYSAQFRIEVFNVFNQVSLAQFSDGASDPNQGGGVVGVSSFGYNTTAQNANRQFQFGLKIMF